MIHAVKMIMVFSFEHKHFREIKLNPKPVDIVFTYATI